LLKKAGFERRLYQDRLRTHLKYDETCTFSALQAIDLLVDLRRIVGGIERVVELVDRLDETTAKRKDEVSERFKQGDQIGFSHVEIRTPRGEKKNALLLFFHLS